MFGVIVVSTEEQRESWLKEVREIVGKSFPGPCASDSQALASGGGQRGEE